MYSNWIWICALDYSICCSFVFFSIVIQLWRACNWRAKTSPLISTHIANCLTTLGKEQDKQNIIEKNHNNNIITVTEQLATTTKTNHSLRICYCCLVFLCTFHSTFHTENSNSLPISCLFVFFFFLCFLFWFLFLFVLIGICI